LDGETRRLAGQIAHDDRKPYARWLASQHRYAALEAQRLRSTPLRDLRKRDLIRRVVVLAPVLVPVYCLLVLGLWRNGSAGWQYLRERTIAEWLIARELLRPGRSRRLA
jgi:hypothetical protein